MPSVVHPVKVTLVTDCCLFKTTLQHLCDLNELIGEERLVLQCCSNYHPTLQVFTTLEKLRFLVHCFDFEISYLTTEC